MVHKIQGDLLRTYRFSVQRSACLNLLSGGVQLGIISSNFDAKPARQKLVQSQTCQSNTTAMFARRSAGILAVTRARLTAMYCLLKLTMSTVRR